MFGWVLTAYNSANDGECLRMAEGLGKDAGLALLAVSMADAFDFTQERRTSSIRSCPTILAWKER